MVKNISMKNRIPFITIKNLFFYFIVCITLTSCGTNGEPSEAKKLEDKPQATKEAVKPKTSEEALETKKLLGRLQAKTEVGINRNEYNNAVADLKYASRQISDEKEKEAFQRIVKIHEIAYTFWDECYSVNYSYNCSKFNGMQPVLASFPELYEKESDYTTYLGGSHVWHTDSVIRELWAMANNELDTIEY